MGNFVDQVGLVAHNSFVQCFVELGILGGTLFVAAFYLAVWEPYSFKLVNGNPQAQQLNQLRPCILAIVASAIVGMLSSTRSYSVPTYMMLGLAAAYVCMAERFVESSSRPLRGKLFHRICMMSALMFVSLYIYARLSVVWKS